MKIYATKSLFFILFAVMVVCNSAQGQHVIVVQHSGTPSFYANFSDAVAGASNGDTIYLPGFSQQFNQVIIDKKLYIIGAGHSTDSTAVTGRTFLAGDIYFVTGADSSSLEGFYLYGDVHVGTSVSDQYVNNLRLSRINTNNLYLGVGTTSTYKGASGCTISECVFRGEVFALVVSNVLIDKSILRLGPCGCSGESPVQYCNGCTIRNSIVFAGTASEHAFSNDTNMVVENSILYNYADNEAWGDNLSFNVAVENCLSNVRIYEVMQSNCYDSVANIFVQYNLNNDFETDDLHLNDPLSYLGNDGTQVGIYGTGLPFKEGALPTNPHILFKSISPATDASGNLNINIKIEAQDH